MESEKESMNKKWTSDVGCLHYTDLLPVDRDGFENTQEFLMRVMDILMEYIKKSNDRSSKVLDFHQPSQLQEVLDLEIPEGPLNLDQILVDCKEALKYQVKTGHPRYFNQLSSGLDIVSMAGEWLTATANTNMFTYEIAPVFILMEQVVTKKMRKIIGYNNGDSILAPGGAISNLYACMIARHKLFPACKTKGLRDLPQLVMYTSENSHYSLTRAGATMGLGSDFVVHVKCDERGRMIPAEFERHVIADKAKGYKPFFVNATAGTTVVGAFDPIQQIADICQKHNLWLHVDAAWGGGLLLSKRYKSRMDGIERADSVTWNPHKLMGCLLQCSTIHFKEKGLMLSCNQMCADYLFQGDKHYDVTYDTGDKVIQCGRHNDVFKLWLMWRSKGDSGFEKQIELLMELTQYMIKKIKEKGSRFHLIISQPECTNICFWYIPASLRNVIHGKDREQKLGQITAKLKGRMMNKGSLMINYQPMGNIPNFFRVVLSNAAVRKDDIDFLLEELDRLGFDL